MFNRTLMRCCVGLSLSAFSLASCAPTSTATFLPTTSPEASATITHQAAATVFAPPTESSTAISTPTAIATPAADRPGFNIAEWKTDFSKHSVPYAQIISGGPPRDGIPPIDHPSFVSSGDASQWLKADEPVVVFSLNADSRAYPLQIMIWHEIVNDTVGGKPVTITFCPLCNAAIAFERTLDGVTYDFGTTGKLRHSDLVMWDRQTESWWQQFSGEAIIGELTGKQLKFLPASMVSFADFKQTHPNGKVLSRETGFERSYGRNPYVGYDNVESSPFLFDGKSDPRLRAMDRVVALTIDNVAVAYPYATLSQMKVVNDTQGGKPIVVLWQSGTASALDGTSIAGSRDIGATGVFERVLNGKTLTFKAETNSFVDDVTNSRWNILGQAIEGTAKGQQLTAIVHFDHFWFAWAAFKPNTIIYK